MAALFIASATLNGEVSVMAVLSSADRKDMPKGEFAGPGKSFPVNDANHARMAISGATRSEHAGNISQSEEEKIKATARGKLDGKSDPPADHKAAVAKMHPEHVHKLVEHAMSGKAGPEMQQMAQQAMQGPAGPTQDSGASGETNGAPQRSNPFSGGMSDGDQDDQPMNRAAMFSGGR
jgi:hypothetical protein